MNRKHIKTIEVKPCSNPQVSAPKLESTVMQMIEKIMLVPKELVKCLASAEKRIRMTQLKFERQIKQFDEHEKQLQEQRAEILDQYATGGLQQNEYLEKCLWFDNEARKVKLEKSELIKRIPILHKKDVIDVSLRIFCETARARFERINNFDTKRQFCLDFIDEVQYDHGKITVKGFVPIQLQKYSDPDQTSEASRVEFSIKGSR